MVTDSHTLLALVFNEPTRPWVLQHLTANAPELRISTVNYAEALILITDRQPALASQLREQIAELPIRFIAPTTRQAELAAEARLKYPLNLGDCFAYALAKDEACDLLTLDRDFRNTDVSVVIPPKV